MKISPEDPILTAYALGELDESSRASVEEAFAGDESLAYEGATISSLVGLMSEALQSEVFSLGEERRSEVFKAGRRPDAELLVLENRRKSRRQSLSAVVGVAAVVVAGFVALSRFQTSGPGASSAGEAASAGVISKSGLGQQGEGAVLLPLTIEAVDPSFVEKALTETGQLPEAGRFEPEAWVNASVLESAPLVRVGNVGMYAELGPCSWDDEQMLLLVNLRSLDEDRAAVKVALNFNPERVKSSRLLGEEEALGSALPEAGMMTGSQTVFYEIKLLPGEARVGSIDLEVGDEASGYLPLRESPKEEGEISNDFRQARLLAEYARWGASETRHFESLEKIADSARDLLGQVTDEKIRYALDMILLSEESLRK